MRFAVDWDGKEKYNYNCNHASSYKQWDGIMAQALQQTEELTVPDGGIGNFVMDDDEIEAAYGSDDGDGVEEYGNEGIAQFPELAKKMAAMGREGDDVVAHLQTGELVIPLALIEQDEALKEGIFQRLRDMGVEDPERYVVGSDANSINPVTGAPEFFLKKLVKKVVSGVKKVVNAVVKVVKKVAPIILPIALSFTPLGPIYGAALGSGIGTLIQGGSIKDALKSALVAGATGAVFQGFTGGGSFMENIKTGLADPIGRFGQTISGAQTSLSNVFGGEAARAANAGQPGFFSQYQPTPTVQPTVSTSGVAEGAIPEVAPTGAEVGVTDPAAAGTTAPLTTGDVANQAVTLNKPPTFMESIKDAFTPGGRTFTESLGDAFFPNATLSGGSLPAGEVITNPTATQYLQASGINPLAATTAQQTAAQNIVQAAAPGMFRTYAPLAAAGLGVATAAGAFTPIPAEPLDIAQRDEQGNIITGEDLVAGDPGKYLVGDLGEVVLDPNTGTYVRVPSYSSGMVQNLNSRPVNYASYSVPTQYGYTPTNYLQSSTPGGPFARPVTAAEGGAIFPRRNGGIMPDEGIPGQDSVRAMLMPGEFVMTTDAVRGLGNGDLNKGIKNMYSVMRNLESRGRAMA